MGGKPAPDYKPRPPAGPGRFANRADLSQPASVPTGLPYGDAQRLKQGQVEAPVPANRTRGGGTPLAPPGGGSPIPSLQQLLTRPTDQPEVPVTSGLFGGGTPGPEALAEPTTGESQALRAMLMSLQLPGMPPQMRALGALMNVVEHAKTSARIRGTLIPSVTDEELFAPLQDEQAIEPLYPDAIGAGPMTDFHPADSAIDFNDLLMTLDQMDSEKGATPSAPPAEMPVDPNVPTTPTEGQLGSSVV